MDLTSQTSHEVPPPRHLSPPPPHITCGVQVKEKAKAAVQKLRDDLDEALAQTTQHQQRAAALEAQLAASQAPVGPEGEGSARLSAGEVCPRPPPPLPSQGVRGGRREGPGPLRWGPENGLCSPLQRFWSASVWDGGLPLDSVRGMWALRGPRARLRGPTVTGGQGCGASVTPSTPAGVPAGSAVRHEPVVFGAWAGARRASPAKHITCGRASRCMTGRQNTHTHTHAHPPTSPKGRPPPPFSLLQDKLMLEQQLHRERQEYAEKVPP